MGKLYEGFVNIGEKIRAKFEKRLLWCVRRIFRVEQDEVMSLRRSSEKLGWAETDSVSMVKETWILRSGMKKVALSWLKEKLRMNQKVPSLMSYVIKRQSPRAGT